MTPQRVDRTLLILVALLVPGSAAPQLLRLGSEFQVNTVTASTQGYPVAAAAASGGFVVTWASFDAATSYNVVARRFTSSGAPLGGEIQVNLYTPQAQEFPAAAMDADGDFVVVWRSSLQDGSLGGIFARRFNASGTALGGELQVNVVTLDTQFHPTVAMEPDGDFVVAWDSSLQDGSGLGVFARRFSSAGSSLTAEIQVAVATLNGQSDPFVAARANGDFVVAWTGEGEDNPDLDVFARRFVSSGTALLGEIEVNTYQTGNQTSASAAVDGNGDFVVSWTSPGQDGNAAGVFARRFSNAGTPLTGEVQVNAYTIGPQDLSWVTTQSDGDFAVVWAGAVATDGYGILARRFRGTGAPLGDQVQVNTFTVDTQTHPTLATDGANRYVVTWMSANQDGSGNGVFGQRVAKALGLDVDGNGAVNPLTDTILALRYAFGFRGATLISGAVDADCTRCDAPSIEAYLGELTR